MDRKALIRKYKETPRQMGVYRISSTANGKALIAASRDLPAALNRHRAQLRMGVHPNRQLQADWNAFGDDAFSFETLDTLPPSDQPDYDPTDDLETLKKLWLKEASPSGEPGY